MNSQAQAPPSGKVWQAIVLRVGMFILLVVMGHVLFPWILQPFGLFGAAALSTFFAGLIANLFTLRIYEQLPLRDAGFRWNNDATKNLLHGLGAGMVAALLVVGGMLMTGSATLVRTKQGFDLGSVLFVTALLAAGAAGEELMFRGYGFQYLIPRIGEWATILPLGVLFGFLHAGNQNSTLLAVINTTVWGMLLGYAFLRSQDLWLPIGIHFGWNWTLPMLGANLSGFQMQVAGLELKPDVQAPLSGGAYGPEGSILTTVVAAGVAWYLHRAPIVAQPSELLARGAAANAARGAAANAEPT